MELNNNFFSSLENNFQSTQEEHNFPLGLEGFFYSDLYDSHRMKDLIKGFEDYLSNESADIFLLYKSYHADDIKNPILESKAIITLASYVSRFIAKLFHVEHDYKRLQDKILSQKEISTFKDSFVSKRVLKNLKKEVFFTETDESIVNFIYSWFEKINNTNNTNDEELKSSYTVNFFIKIDKEYIQSFSKKNSFNISDDILYNLRELKEGLLNNKEFSDNIKNFQLESNNKNIEHLLEGKDEYVFLQYVLTLFESYFIKNFQTNSAHYQNWVSFRLPKTLNHNCLVKLLQPNADLKEMFVGPPENIHNRDAFSLTDKRMPPREIHNEVSYCLYCHERDKDSCSKGFHSKDDGYKKNALGIQMAGCPLDEKISEANYLKNEADPLAALSVVVIDNPMLPGTGHRICNDCMKACIFQKQDPVNIPQIETSILTDIFELNYGFEIWSFLTRWNPLNKKRPHALPYNGKNILVVGMGPAGYTLSHHLLNDGFGVIGIDGLKIEPLPEWLVGGENTIPKPIKNIKDIFVDLNKRIPLGFGGVSEYGITVRWDKNFLTALYLNLARRWRFKIYGGIRFGGTMTIDDAWSFGFDHIAIAIGAGKPTIIDMKNNLIRGIRKASDFLMGLQLSGAFKKETFSNLQVQLPALVVGGGLTAIDTATEVMAYYIVQVEKIRERYLVLEKFYGTEKIKKNYNEEEWSILQIFLEHGLAVENERNKALSENRKPKFAQMVDEWGGVAVVYRKNLTDSPAYKLNHEEITESLKEGIRYIEKLNPIEATADQYGSLSSVIFEKQSNEHGKWESTKEYIELPAKSLFIAAGTSPNTMPEQELPGTFKMDDRNQYYKSHRVVWTDSGKILLEPVEKNEIGFFTSYFNETNDKDNPKLISFYGDNHPKYAGNVVKAMASAKNGYPYLSQLFQSEVRYISESEEKSKLAKYNNIVAKLDQNLIARVVKVERLTSNIVEIIIKAPLAAKHFEPGQFYRLQNFEIGCTKIKNTSLLFEGIALTGAWVDKEAGILSLIVLEMGSTSRMCAYLKENEHVLLMGPTGTPTEIPQNKTVLLVGGGLGNAVLFSIAKALKLNNNKIIYFAGYKSSDDIFKREEIESSTDVIVWSHELGAEIKVNRPQDKTCIGNIITALTSYAQGLLGNTEFSLKDADVMLVIGSDKMMSAVKTARYGVLKGYLKTSHIAIGSINSPMQCMMKEVCAQCLQRHVDPITKKETFVFSCVNQDQNLDSVDFDHLNQRLKANSVQEKLSSLWFDYIMT